MRLPRLTRRLALAAACLLVLMTSPALRAGQAPVKGLTEGALLRSAYDLAYDADFAGAEVALARACGPAPAEACEVVGLGALWWRVAMDVENRSLDATFRSRTDAAIDHCEAWVGREPRRAEAWFYLGAAYGARVQFRAARAPYLAAPRDGQRIKTPLDPAHANDTSLRAAKLGLGLYEY
jgi:hypothetical protein